MTYDEINDKLTRIECNTKELAKSGNLYYVNPDKEPIVKILSNFSKFRFETAVSALWKRNFIILFLFGISLLICAPFMFILKILHLNPKELKSFEDCTKTYFHICFVKGKYIKSTLIGFFMTIFGLLKFIYNSVYTTGWTIVMTLRYILIPLLRALGGFAIAFAMFFRKR